MLMSMSAVLNCLTTNYHLKCPTNLVSHDSIACVGKNELSEQEKKSLELPAQ